uniref:Protein E6 n=1 Tax=Human papillomavirus TaxID=10566 RepID=A0A385PIX7_9PAPI|nr:MAG: E6 protein [Human papillomavirus]
MWAIQQFLPVLMENLFPTCLREYCDYFDINFFDLRLLCIFCKQLLDQVDLAKFHKKKLCLVWRGNRAFACCDKCLQLSARYESERHCVCVVKAENLHGLIGVPLQDVLLRCNLCLGVLTTSEKVDLIAGGKLVWLIRGYWRATCSSCM